MFFQAGCACSPSSCDSAAMLDHFEAFAYDTSNVATSFWEDIDYWCGLVNEKTGRGPWGGA